MGVVRYPEQVKLVFFVFGSFIDYWIEELKPSFSSLYGPMDYISEVLEFDKFTHYYNPEMGADIKGCLLSFERLIHPFQLADIKRTTNEIEMKYAVEGKRKFNVDPGYISPSNFILASTKYWGSRIYLRKGIYAEVTLLYLRGSFRPWEMTYPNYRDEKYIAHLNAIRDIFMKQRRKEKINEVWNKGVRVSQK